MKRVNSIGLLVNEINSCVASNNTLAALYIALSLPDVCAKIMESKTVGKGERYKEWFNKYVTKYVSVKFGEETLVYFDADDCYKLRNALFHAGEYDIENDKNLEQFIIRLDKTASHTYRDSIERQDIDENGNVIKTYPKRTKRVICAHLVCKYIVNGVLDFLKEPYIDDSCIPTFKLYSIPSIFTAKSLKDFIKTANDPFDFD